MGADPELVPAAPIVGALRLLSWLVPHARVPFTPFEDPSGYACPVDSNRNYVGHWPLVTSKMLLDLTTQRVADDQASGRLRLACRMLVVCGTKDEAVPAASIRKFFAAADQSYRPELLELPDAGHHMMLDPPTCFEIPRRVFERLNEWLGSAGPGEVAEFP